MADTLPVFLVTEAKNRHGRITMSTWHARIIGSDYAAMADLVTRHKVTVARHTVEKVADGYRVDAHASEEQIRALESAGYKVERLEDADVEGMARQREKRESA